MLSNLRLIIVGICLTLMACAQQPMPTINLQTEGWQLWFGQALWQPPKDRPRVAGDILLALHSNGDRFIELTKTPVVIFSAQTHGQQWSLSTIDRDRAVRGRGQPTERFVWFYLPQYLADKSALPSGWEVSDQGDMVDFSNPKTGETIRLVLDRAL